MFDKIIMNPPYNIGSNILAEAINHSNDIACLMPASKFFNKNLYQHVKSVERVDNLFDAVVQDNNLICKCSLFAWKYDNNKFRLESCNQTYRKFYEYNINNYKGITNYRCDNKDISEFDIDLDFVEHARAVSSQCGNGFGPNGGGYMFNVEKDLDKAKEHDPSLKFCIHFNKSIEKDNYSKWWYYKRKKKGLASKVLIGVGTLTAGDFHIAIPQIDWEKISENQYWKNGEYDKAVLDEMVIRNIEGD